jgi:hypothetical protein
MTKGAKTKTSPSNSVNLGGFFHLYVLFQKTGKRQKKP